MVEVTETPTVVATCPSCGEVVKVQTIRDSVGILHPPMPLPVDILVHHRLCDFNKLIRELSNAAMRNSKVTVFRIQE
jgi:hypothetical protein